VSVTTAPSLWTAVTSSSRSKLLAEHRCRVRALQPLLRTGLPVDPDAVENDVVAVVDVEDRRGLGVVEVDVAEQHVVADVLHLRAGRGVRVRSVDHDVLDLDAERGVDDEGFTPGGDERADERLVPAVDGRVAPDG
jgi:hypothetical protein